jgi:hypothetical protein
MSVSKLTQRLLVQSEELNRSTEIAWPRFHDLHRIYQIQNIALAGSREARSSNIANAGLAICNMPSQQSRSPQESFESQRLHPEQPGQHDRKYDTVVNFPVVSNFLADSPISPSVLSRSTATTFFPVERHSFPVHVSTPLFEFLQAEEMPAPTLNLFRTKRSELGKRQHNSSYATLAHLIVHYGG